MFVERLLHEKQPNSFELGMFEIRLLPDPWMSGKQLHGGFDRIDEPLRKSKILLQRIVISLQRDVSE